MENEELTAASDIFKDLTKKFYKITSQADDLLKAPASAPASPERKRSTSVATKMANYTMPEVRDFTATILVRAKEIKYTELVISENPDCKSNSSNKPKFVSMSSAANMVKVF